MYLTLLEQAHPFPLYLYKITRNNEGVCPSKRAVSVHRSLRFRRHTDTSDTRLSSGSTLCTLFVLRIRCLGAFRLHYPKASPNFAGSCHSGSKSSGVIQPFRKAAVRQTEDGLAIVAQSEKRHRKRRGADKKSIHKNFARFSVYRSRVRVSKIVIRFRKRPIDPGNLTRKGQNGPRRERSTACETVVRKKEK